MKRKKIVQMASEPVSREEAFTGMWDGLESLDKIYRAYGPKNYLWTLRKLLEGEKIDRVLDLGCGVGFYFKFFRDFGSKQLCGLEYDEMNVSKAISLNENLDAEIIQGDILNLSDYYAEKSFDVVICLSLVEHFRNPRLVIRNALSLVKKGGVLILEMPNCRNPIYYYHNIKRKNDLPFMLWWGIREWKRILNKVDECSLERVLACDLLAYFAYIPMLLSKFSHRLLDIEINIENNCFRNCGSAAFYKLRKL